MIDLSKAKHGDVFPMENGNTATYIAVDPDNIDIHYMKVSESIHVYTVSGVYYYGSVPTYNLKPQKRKLEGWVNVYTTNLPGCGWSSKKTAHDVASATNHIACLDLSKYNITFDEGEGL